MSNTVQMSTDLVAASLDQQGLVQRPLRGMAGRQHGPDVQDYQRMSEAVEKMNAFLVQITFQIPVSPDGLHISAGGLRELIMDSVQRISLAMNTYLATLRAEQPEGASASVKKNPPSPPQSSRSSIPHDQGVDMPSECLSESPSTSDKAFSESEHDDLYKDKSKRWRHSPGPGKP